MNTIENNKLIAEFMGLKPIEVFGSYSISKDQVSVNCKTESEAFESFCKSTKYHLDWNWLMEVVEKIESIVWEHLNDTSFNVTIGATLYCVIQDNNGGVIEIIGEGKSKIESVYIACVEFIKWYNKQK